MKSSRNWSTIVCIYRDSRGGVHVDFAAEWDGSHLIALDKASGVIRGIAPVDIVQATQQTTVKTCIDTYTNFKQLTLSKDDSSH